MISLLTFSFLRGGLLPAFFVLLITAASAQDLPSKIRGYKVYREKISVNTNSQHADASVKIGEPELVDLSLNGLTFELPAEFVAANQSGKIRMVTFTDLRVNGIEVEPEEYLHPFEFRKGEPLKLPKPVRILLPSSGILQAAWKEMTESKDEWTITGRVFVFGKFRKFGFYHKRVVPIDLNLTIQNPARRK